MLYLRRWFVYINHNGSLFHNPIGLLFLALTGIYLFMVLNTCFVFEGKTYFTLVDDAMISMRYAEHLAEGDGLVWNKGEAPVEGYSNTLWTLAMAAVHLLPVEKNMTSLVVMLLSVAILLVNLHYLNRILLFFSIGRQLRFLGLFITGLSFPILFWSLRGLEVGMEICFITLCIYHILQFSKKKSFYHAIFLGLLLPLLFLVRIDTVKELLILITWVIFIFFKNYRSIKMWYQKQMIIIAPLILTMFCFYIFRSYYFGDVLPNTYYLKVTGITLQERILRGVNTFLLHNSDDIVIYLCMLPLLWLLRKDIRIIPCLFLFFLATVQIVYSVYVGGDYVDEQVYGGNRFIAVSLQYLLLLFIVILDYFKRTLHIKQTYGVTLLLGISLLLIHNKEAYGLYFKKNFPMLKSDISRAKTGLLLNEYTDATTWLGVHAAGNIPYFAERNCIDLLGKADLHIAKTRPKAKFRPGHNKWDYEYAILQRKPDIIADDWGSIDNFINTNQAPYTKIANRMWVSTVFYTHWEQKDNMLAGLLLISPYTMYE